MKNIKTKLLAVMLVAVVVCGTGIMAKNVTTKVAIDPPGGSQSFGIDPPGGDKDA